MFFRNRKKNGYTKYKIEFGKIKGDVFGTNDGYVKIGYNPDGSIYTLCFKKPEMFSDEETEAIYKRMREVRLKGEELTELQPIPSLPRCADDKIMYDVVANANTWLKFRSKARDPRDIYCLTNKELVVNADEIQKWFHMQAEKDISNVRTNPEGPYANTFIVHLKKVSQVLQDISAIYKAISQDEIDDILHEEYTMGDQAVARKLFESVNSTTLGLYNQAALNKEDGEGNEKGWIK